MTLVRLKRGAVTSKCALNTMRTHSLVRSLKKKHSLSFPLLSAPFFSFSFLLPLPSSFCSLSLSYVLSPSPLFSLPLLSLLLLLSLSSLSLLSPLLSPSFPPAPSLPPLFLSSLLSLYLSLPFCSFSPSPLFSPSLHSPLYLFLA